jgi:calcineurin-like phosphoesterase family protein
MSTIFFSSDHHFGHRNVLTLGTGRPFADLEEMREQLIERHNSVVKHGDTVYFMGDLFWRTLPVSEACSILARMKGQKHFIWGNHDEVMENNPYLLEYFQSVSQYKRIHIPNEKGKGIFLCHYAMRTWYKSHRGYYHLYGHSHGGLSNTHPDDTGYLSMDIGVDTHDYYPWALEEIKSIMEGRTFCKTVNKVIEQGRRALSYPDDANFKAWDAYWNTVDVEETNDDLA